MQRTTFELVYDGKIKLCFPADSPEEAGEYVKNEIAGNGDWKDLVGLDPDRCQLRVTTVIRDYYDLNGKQIGSDAFCGK